MNLEGITLNLLVKELAAKINGGKIAKVFMPSKHSLLLLVKTATAQIPLFANLGGDRPLFYIPHALPERPVTPPAFCMLLRKYLEEGRITAVSQSGLDRIITFEVAIIGPAKQIVSLQLIFELTGKNSNIIFVKDGMIIDALKHIGIAQSRFRQLLPGLPYQAPPVQDGSSFLTVSAHSLLESCLNMTETPLSQALIKNTIGIGKNTVQELLVRCQLPPTTQGLTLEKRKTFLSVLTVLQTEINSCFQAKNHCVYGCISKRNVMTALSLYHPTNPENCTVKEFPDILTALDYSASLVPVEIPDKELLCKKVLSSIHKAQKKDHALAQDLKAAANADAQRVIADTLMANIYRLKKGEVCCELRNIYTDAPLKITLSPQLSPIDNAQHYYKKYNKYKRALTELVAQQEENRALLDYLNSLENALDLAVSKQDIEEIKQEMIEENILKPSGKKKTATLSKAQPQMLKLSPDTSVYIGKNNKQNDYVTFKLAKAGDLWFHAKDVPGAHVILKTTLSEISDEDIKKAASLAALYSKAKNSGKVAIDCTQRRFVKKPHGAKPGFVIYTNQQTLYVEPKL